jgi:hypothetical protein
VQWHAEGLAQQPRHGAVFEAFVVAAATPEIALRRAA